ncbi:hypothetical protein [Pseudomonas sp. BN515]|uniref:hypothetical protein n=1 Tax=Pseudomonas sp. BN515 TaxID=2567892 RepID=UPI0024571EE1|nr:hypothetical protein [Pseudomonas sp. BN515]MDH4873014.1 hypothetical protein [Pseudomonas sp. BN515]
MAFGKVVTQLVIEGINKSKKAFDEADGQLKKLTATAKAAGAVLAGAISVAALSEWVRTSIDAIDMTGELAERVGMAASEFAGLQYAAKFASIEGEALAATLIKFNQNVVKAAEGGKAQAEAFDSIGVSIRNADGSVKGSSQLLLEIADRFAELPDGAQKTALAIELFGKQGAKLLPLLNKGSAGIGELTQQARELGLVLDDSAYAASGEFNDSMDVLAASSEGAGLRVAANLVPALNDVTGLLLDFSKDARSAGETANFLGTGLKLLTSVGVVVVAVFKSIGDQIGAMAAVVAAVVRGDFKGASEIASQSFDDMVDTADNAGRRLEKLWNGDFGQEAQIEQNQRLLASFDATVSGMGKTAESAAAHMNDLKDTQKQLVKDAQESLKAQVSAQTKANAELEKAKQAQVDTAKRYKDALAKLEAGASGDPSYGQAQTLKVQARQAQQAGNVDEAKRKAQAALEIIQSLQDAGANTLGFAGFVKELQSIEQAADQIQLARAQESVAHTTESVKQLKAEIEAVKKTDISINLPPDQVAAITKQFEDLAAKLSPMLTFTATVKVPSTDDVAASSAGSTTTRGFATGTRSAPPGMAWVGENGPELLKFRGGEEVFTTDASRNLMQRLAGMRSPDLASGSFAEAASAIGVGSKGTIVLDLGGGRSYSLEAAGQTWDDILRNEARKHRRRRS